MKASPYSLMSFVENNRYPSATVNLGVITDSLRETVDQTPHLVPHNLKS